VAFPLVVIAGLFHFRGQKATPQNSTPVHATAWEMEKWTRAAPPPLRVLDPKQEWLFQKRNCHRCAMALTLNCSRSWI
jgi:hypothetical protein